MAGGKVLLAVDHDDNAVRTYRANFPRTKIHQGDVRDLTVKECCRLAGIRPGELDVLDGSPPCQGFCTIGRRAFSDVRNRLFEEFVRLLEGLQPRACILENVSGLVKGTMKLVFADCLESMKACGYRVTARLLDAQDFGVPQKRQRIVFVGAREDLGVAPSHPEGRSEPKTVRQALGLLGDAKIKSNNQFYRKERWRSIDGPCTTLTRHPPFLLIDGRQRVLTVEECAALAGFPRDFKWGKGACQLIGNCVPPPLMRAVAEHVRDEILMA
jgi:DNA (cytosine-5)-methyltransferase 1